MKHELVDRYVYAVTRHLPTKDRDEVGRELESLIGDLLEERCGGATPTEKDVRVVLVEYGTPEEVAMQYLGETGKSLISGTYYMYYMKVLKIVLPIVAVAVPFAVLLGLFFDEQSGLSALFAPTVESTSAVNALVSLPFELIGGTIGGIIQAFAIITLVFAILEHKKVSFTDNDLFMELPEVPKKKNRIDPWEPLAGMLFSIVAAIVFLLLPQVVGVWFGDDRGWIPVFSTGVIRSLWLPILIWVIASLIKEVVRLIEGRYSMRVALVTIGTNIIVLVSSLVVFLSKGVLNPEFTARIKDFLLSEGILAGATGSMIADWIVHINLVFMVLIGVGLLIDTATTLFKSLKSIGDA